MFLIKVVLIKKSVIRSNNMQLNIEINSIFLQIGKRWKFLVAVFVSLFDNKHDH